MQTQIPTNWRETTLGGTASAMYSGGTPSTSEPAYYGGSVPWLRTQEVNFNYINGTEIKISDEGMKASSARWVPKDSVIIAMYGNSAGRVAYTNLQLTTNQACCNIVTDPNVADPKFIFFNLENRYRELESMANGGAQQNLSVGVLKEFPIVLPPITDQKKIVDVLSILDDKIELLRQENKTLESIAQTLFKHWFVDFEFPNEDGKPYKSSGGKMIDSDLGQLPMGWSIGKLGDVIEMRGGSTPSTENPAYWGGNIRWTSPKDLSTIKDLFLFETEKTITNEGLKQISGGLLPADTLLLSSRAPIGYLAFADIPLAINQGYIAFTPTGKWKNIYLYLWLKRNMKLVEASAHGTTFMEISKSSFRQIEALLPDQGTLDSFQETIDPAFRKIRNNCIQIRTLSRLRDTLLPKLMKGKIRV